MRSLCSLLSSRTGRPTTCLGRAACHTFTRHAAQVSWLFSLPPLLTNSGVPLLVAFPRHPPLTSPSPSPPPPPLPSSSAATTCTRPSRLQNPSSRRYALLRPLGTHATWRRSCEPRTQLAPSRSPCSRDLPHRLAVYAPTRQQLQRRRSQPAEKAQLLPLSVLPRQCKWEKPRRGLRGALPLVAAKCWSASAHFADTLVHQRKSLWVMMGMLQQAWLSTRGYNIAFFSGALGCLRRAARGRS